MHGGGLHGSLVVGHLLQHLSLQSTCQKDIEKSATRLEVKQCPVYSLNFTLFNQTVKD